MHINLHGNPSPHPGVDNLLSFIDKTHIQQQLSSASDSTVQCRENPGMRVTSMLPNENRLVLSLVVRWDVQFLLTDDWRGPSTSLMLIDFPALPVKVPSVLFSSNGAVNLHHGALDESDVVGCA